MQNNRKYIQKKIEIRVPRFGILVPAVLLNICASVTRRDVLFWCKMWLWNRLMLSKNIYEIFLLVLFMVLSWFYFRYFGFYLRS